MLPSRKPQAALSYFKDIVDQHKDRLEDCPVVLVGVRGYYLDTMGKKGKNDRGIYDDAIAVLNLNNGTFATFNANTDPSIWKPKVASLKCGVWWYKKGLHGLSTSSPYPALRQLRPVTVHRDGRADETGMFWINIHCGGVNTTSSLGCQTIPPKQWDSFKALVYDQMARENQKEIPYILVEVR
jgi:lysozyme